MHSRLRYVPNCRRKRHLVLPTPSPVLLYIHLSVVLLYKRQPAGRLRQSLHTSTAAAGTSGEGEGEGPGKRARERRERRETVRGGETGGGAGEHPSLGTTDATAAAAAAGKGERQMEQEGERDTCGRGASGGSVRFTFGVADLCWFAGCYKAPLSVCARNRIAEKEKGTKPPQGAVVPASATRGVMWLVPVLPLYW